MKIDATYNDFLNNMTDTTVAMAKADEASFKEMYEKMKSRAEAEKAGEQFEAYFTYKLMKQMYSSIPKSSVMGNNKEEYYIDMLLDAYSKEMAKGEALGIKKMLVEQIDKDKNKVNDENNTQDTKGLNN